MIGAPVNDLTCLGEITAEVAALVERRAPKLVELAAEYGSTEALAAWIRSLPQRDDNGDPDEGPKVDGCDPPQRLRIPAPDPNCVERSCLHMAVAELIDPGPVRQLATITTPVGRHTFLVENGDPVILDPAVPRNALEAGLYQMTDRHVGLTPEEQVDWIAGIAEEPARGFRNGARRVRHARDAMRRLLRGMPLAPRLVPDVVFTLVLAEREAHLFGARGVAVQRAVMATLDAAHLAYASKAHGYRNRASVRIGRTEIRPIDLGTLGSVARVAGRVGVRVGAVAAQAALGKLGVTPELIAEVEHELNRDGLSLGPLARASEDRRLFGPVMGSLAAVKKGGAS